jgi:hypothetical protein
MRNTCDRKSREGVDRIVEEPVSRSMLDRKLTAKAMEVATRRTEQ